MATTNSSYGSIPNTPSNSSRPIIIHTTYAQPLLSSHNLHAKRYPLTTNHCFNLKKYCYFILLLLLLPLCVSIGLVIGGHEVASTAYDNKLKGETFNINGTCKCIASSNYTDDSGDIHYEATFVPYNLGPCASAKRMNYEYIFDLHWKQNMDHIERCFTDTACSEVFLCGDLMCNEYGLRYGQLTIASIVLYVVAGMIVIAIFICGVLKGKSMRIYLHKRYLGQVNIGGVVSYYDGFGCDEQCNNTKKLHGREKDVI